MMQLAAAIIIADTNKYQFQWQTVSGAANYVFRLHDQNGTLVQEKNGLTEVFYQATVAKNWYTWSVTAIDDDGKVLGSANSAPTYFAPSAPASSRRGKALADFGRNTLYCTGYADLDLWDNDYFPEYDYGASSWYKLTGDHTVSFLTGHDNSPDGAYSSNLILFNGRINSSDGERNYIQAYNFEAGRWQMVFSKEANQESGQKTGYGLTADGQGFFVDNQLYNQDGSPYQLDYAFKADILYADSSRIIAADGTVVDYSGNTVRRATQLTLPAATAWGSNARAANAQHIVAVEQEEGVATFTTQSLDGDQWKKNTYQLTYPEMPDDDIFGWGTELQLQLNGNFLAYAAGYYDASLLSIFRIASDGSMQQVYERLYVGNDCDYDRFSWNGKTLMRYVNATGNKEQVPFTVTLGADLAWVAPNTNGVNTSVLAAVSGSTADTLLYDSDQILLNVAAKNLGDVKSEDAQISIKVINTTTNGEVFARTQSLTALTAGSSKSFLNYAIGSLSSGEYELQLSIAGGYDAAPGNNQLTRVFTVATEQDTARAIIETLPDEREHTTGCQFIGVIGLGGDVADTFSEIELETGSYRLNVADLNGGVKITVTDALGKVKGSGVTSVKNGVTSLNFNSGMPLLLTSGAYKVTISSQDNGKTGGDYNFAMTGSVFYRADHLDNFTDLKEAAAQAANFSILAAANESSLRLDDWVGFGDPIDYRRVNVANSGYYNFELSGLENAAKLTVYTLNNGTLTVLKSLIVTPNGVVGNDRGEIGNVFLSAATDYYVAVEAPGAETGRNTAYTLIVTRFAITGRTGADTLTGSAWNDLFQYNADSVWANSYRVMPIGTADEGLIKLGGYRQPFDTFSGGNGYDLLKLTADNDALLLDDIYSPIAGAQEMRPRLSNIEEIRGGEGNDLIDLSSRRWSYDNARLLGEEGDDSLFGNNGDDLLWGGKGNDRLDGGSGRDIYVFEANWGVDKVSDGDSDFRLVFDQSLAGQLSLNDNGLTISCGDNKATFDREVSLDEIVFVDFAALNPTEACDQIFRMLA